MITSTAQEAQKQLSKQMLLHQHDHDLCRSTFAEPSVNKTIILIYNTSLGSCQDQRTKTKQINKKVVYFGTVAFILVSKDTYLFCLLVCWYMKNVSYQQKNSLNQQ